MSEIKIPFRPFFRAPLLAGEKVMTCRTKKLGEPGDTFSAFDCHFVLTHVMRMRLGFVLSDCFVQEGCRSVQELSEVWTGIHPGTGVDPDQIVWAHCFRDNKP
jgi:hypothetical protein